MAEICCNAATKFRFSKFYQIYNYIKCRRLIFTSCHTLQNVSAVEGIPIKEIENKHVEKLFLDPRVQKILIKITGLDLEKIYRPRKQKLSVPTYKFVTSEKLAELKENAKQRAFEKLQMPPVCKEREPINEILSKNPELQSLNNSKIVFIDITLGVSNRKRAIAVRDSDGTLRKANWDERMRMNQIFFPIAGRQFYTPKLFEKQYLEPLLDQQNYEFVLDYACLQFEPDDPEYIKVAQTAYEHINKNKKFDILRSTRHFGPMAFYLASKKNIDNLLLVMIEKQLIGDAADLLKLFYILNPDSTASTNQGSEASDLDLIKSFIQSRDKQNRSHLELAFQTYQEIREQQMALLEKHKHSKEARVN